MSRDGFEGVSAPVANTPSPSSAVVASTETLSQLEFDRALERVAAYTVSDLGARAVRLRRPSADLAWVRGELEDVTLFRRLFVSGKAVEPLPVQDVGPLVARVKTPGSVLEAGELNELGGALRSMHTIRAALQALEDEAPRIAAMAVELPPRTVDQNITRAIDPDGTVRDEASPELLKVRRQLRAKRKTLMDFLEKLVVERGCDRGDVTVRGDRFVVPVRRDDRSRIRGIVHGESASGGTLFVEPTEVVELGNELSALAAEEARAVLAVLRALTDGLRPHADAVDHGLAMCVRVDDLSARARHAAACDAHEPELRAERRGLAIARGAHPLLVSEGDSAAVPFDLDLAPGEHVLVVSGPNAGGKTVLLKSVGLLCCLAQAGILPSVGPGTILPVFRRIFVDIGDHQSISASLSSFSAHLTALRDILTEADDGSLVLLDELGGGTDPVEGAALAGATLLSLNERRCLTIATTHLSELKELAARTEGVVNGSLHFDVDSLTPTYRFVKGRPGRSYGLAIARRLGLAPEVVSKAEELEPHGAREADAILAELERREEQVERREESASHQSARMARESRELDELRSALEQRETDVANRMRELEREGRDQTRRFLLEARQRVEEAIAEVRTAKDEAAAKAARRHVEQGVREQADALAKLQRDGWRVTTKNGQSQISGRSASGSESSGGRRITLESTSQSHGRFADTPEQQARTEINLRGMTGDEASLVLIRALDDAVAAEVPFVRIIHGKGTGALRARVTEVLRGDRRVRKFAAAPPHQGGNGVTVAELLS